MKRYIHKIVLKILNRKSFTLLLYKLFQGYFYINNSHFSIKLLNLLKSERLHLTNNLANLDFDVTYISHRVSHDRKYSNIINIYQEIIKIYAKIFSAYFYAEKISHIDTMILNNVPELKDSNNHYCFLTSTAIALKSKIIVDIGTASGSSSIAFLLSPAVNHVHSFDIVPLAANKNWVSKESYRNINNYLKVRQDSWTQYVVDLTDKKQFDSYVAIFKKADVILIDIDHSGTSEQILLDYLMPVVKKDCLLIWDDIRVSTMQSFWEELSFPKIDVGSIGHNSGTGISLIANESNE